MIKILNQFLKKHGVLKLFYDKYDNDTPIEEIIKTSPKELINLIVWDTTPQGDDFWYDLHKEWCSLIDKYHFQLKELLEQDMDKVKMKYKDDRYGYTYTTTNTSSTADGWAEIHWG